MNNEITSMIADFIPREIMLAIREINIDPEIADNNAKCREIKQIMPECFEFIGQGTNRIVFKYLNCVYKISLDSQGRKDNVAEFVIGEFLCYDENNAENYTKEQAFILKRFPTVYELSHPTLYSEDEELRIQGICLVQEYWHLCDYDTFYERKEEVLELLEISSDAFIFDDVGFDTKNYLNWGLSPVHKTEDGKPVIGIIDYGYFKPKDSVSFRCPVCQRGGLYYDEYYNFLICPTCNRDDIQPLSIFRQQKESYNLIGGIMITDDEEDDIENMNIEQKFDYLMDFKL